ncbi:DUF2786 domain-containing protein [Nakamurella sp. YIM 132087]|uniref:DUF2786 domain-containing protein n=1 Tax=Nakamurella alba TaxID=2665158 RepID=A0A7K1FW36_9ACTN|nr:DUF2786 domain-containing protein [Nakamurella alba]MTD17423.1 DUF2786 domain-containing protein [Nakamurella alba]
MGKNNQAKRAAKRRERARQSARPTPPRGTGQPGWQPSGGRPYPGGPADPFDIGFYPDDDGGEYPSFDESDDDGPLTAQDAQDLALTMLGGVMYPESLRQLGRQIEAVEETIGHFIRFGATLGPEFTSTPADVATDRFCIRLGELYENGWQPEDLIHVAGRIQRIAKESPWVAHLAGRTTAAAVTAVMCAGIAVEAERSRARERAPEEWVSQLPTDVAPTLLRAGGPDPWSGWEALFATLTFVHTLGRIELLAPPPSRWDSLRTKASASGSPRERSGRGDGSGGGSGRAGHDPKMLTRIRALLAKAEATEYSEEAESFTAKAQELMTRYAIDEALLAPPEERVDVRSRRITLNDPYVEEKATLLNVCATQNHCRAILLSGMAMCTVVGPPLDLDMTEMLFTSLLVQAVSAMHEAGQLHRGDRSPSFRRAFLVSYANRISARLTEATTRVESEAGAALVPVLARTRAAVDEEFERIFPKTVQRGPRSYDTRGWHAGADAADRARLARGQVDG